MQEALLFRATLAGLLGSLVVARRLLECGGIRMTFDDHVAPGDRSVIARALLLPSGEDGGVFAWALPQLAAGLQRLCNVTVQRRWHAGGGLSILAHFRASKMESTLEWEQSAGVPALMALALLNVLAFGICLAVERRRRGSLAFAGVEAVSSALTFMQLESNTDSGKV